MILYPEYFLGNKLISLIEDWLRVLRYIDLNLTIKTFKNIQADNTINKQKTHNE